MTQEAADAATPGLVARASAGDERAREELLAAHLPALRAFVRLRLGRGLRVKETSLDLVQSVCCEALADLGRFEYRGPDSFRHWLFRRAETKLKNRGRFWSRERRSVKRERALPAADGDSRALRELATLCTPSRDAVAREELERFERAFLELPDDYREVILLSRVVGLPHALVAEEMGRTPAATRTLLSRALARLATRME